MTNTATLGSVVLSDCRRALWSWRFPLAVVLGLLALYQPAYPFGFYGGARIVGNSVYGALQDTFGLGVFILYTPVLAAIPYGDAHAWEVSSGMYPYLLRRTGTTRYIRSKIFSTMASGGFALCVPVVLFCGIHQIFFAPQLMSLQALRAVGIELMLLWGYGACWSLCALAFCAWLASPFVALAVPFCVTRALWLLSALVDLSITDPTLTLARVNTVALSFGEIAVQDIGYGLIFCAIFIKGVVRKKC